MKMIVDILLRALSSARNHFIQKRNMRRDHKAEAQAIPQFPPRILTIIEKWPTCCLPTLLLSRICARFSWHVIVNVHIFASSTTTHLAMLVVYHESIALPSPYIKHCWDVDSPRTGLNHTKNNFDRLRVKASLILVIWLAKDLPAGRFGFMLEKQSYPKENNITHKTKTYLGSMAR